MCGGCSPTQTRADPFPIFGALLNAAHRGVSIRVLINDFADTDCPGMISALAFFKLNNIQVKMYTSTAFMHAKYLTVDASTVSISSVNWSKTSYTKNREAGINFSGATTQIVDFVTEVFEADWNQAYDYTVTQTYSAANLKIIQDTSLITVTQPPPFGNPLAYVTVVPTPIELAATTPIYVSTSPDFALAQLLADIQNATTSFHLYTYEISGSELCEELIALHDKGVKLDIMISYRIMSATSCEESNVCYAALHKKGIKVHKSPDYYTFSHNKYWITNGNRVSWSTGNWGHTDYPEGTKFPPYGKTGYQKVNRDFTGTIIQQDVADVFLNVMAEDKVRGSTYTPNNPVLCGF